MEEQMDKSQNGVNPRTDKNTLKQLSEEVKQAIKQDKDFRKALILDLSKYTMNAAGILGVLLTVLVIIVLAMGYSSIGDITRLRMDTYLEKAGEPYKEQFDRLSKIPSYATLSSEIVVNDTAKNFVSLPYFNDIGRYAGIEECDWFITLVSLKGDEIKINSTVDTVEGKIGLRFTSFSILNEPTPPGALSGPAYTRKEITPQMQAKVFIFASRKLNEQDIN